MFRLHIGVAGLMMAGMMAPGQNLSSSLTAALAPNLLQSSTPKIKITDENDRPVSVTSDSSHLNEIRTYFSTFLYFILNIFLKHVFLLLLYYFDSVR